MSEKFFIIKQTKKNYIMKKVAMICALLAFVITANAQTRQQKKAEDKIYAELAQLKTQLREANNKIASISADTSDLYAQKVRLQAAIDAGTITGAQDFAYKNQINKIDQVLQSSRTKTRSSAYQGLKTEEMRLQFRITELELNLRDFTDKTVDEAYTDKIPRELTVTEENRRKRGNNIRQEENDLRREEMSLNKLSATEAEKDELQGYLGLVYNPSRHTTAQFFLYDATGRQVDGADFVLEPGDIQEFYLLPGLYVGRIFVRGTEVGKTMIDSGLRKASYVKGKPYHWVFFLNQER